MSAKKTATRTTTKKVDKKVTHESIYAALSALQGELKVLPKSAKVSFKKKSSDEKVEYSYTPLSEILSEEALYPMLAKHGLSVRHVVEKDGTKDAIVAILTHETAEWVEVEETVKTEQDGTITETTKKTRVLEGELRSGPVVISQGGDMKDTGGMITYARRYSLTMLLGLASEEDLDTQLIDTQNAKNAITFAFGRVKKTLDETTTEKDVDKHKKNLETDLKAVKAGKASSLGLNKEQIETLIGHATVRKRQIKDGIDPADIPEEQEEGTINDKE